MKDNSFLSAKTENIKERTLVTGVCNSQVLCVNPDIEQLSEIIERDPSDLKEPSYIGENRDGSPHVRLDIWMKPVNGTKYYDEKTNSYMDFNEPYKLAMFLTRNEKTNKDGDKFMFINGKVQTSWSKDANTVTTQVNRKGVAWYSGMGVRKCREGEDQIYEFFSKYMNIDLSDDDTNLEFNDYEAILDGDVRELNEMIKAANERGRSVNVLLGVNKGTYQEVYPYSFERGLRKTFNSLIAKANDSYTRFRSDFQNDSTLRSYVRPNPATQADNFKEDELYVSETKSDDELF